MEIFSATPTSYNPLREIKQNSLFLVLSVSLQREPHYFPTLIFSGKTSKAHEIILKEFYYYAKASKEAGKMPI